MAQNQLNNTRGNLLPQNQALQNRFNVSADQSGQDYSRMMGNYGDLLSQAQGSFGPQMAGYANLAGGGGSFGMDPQFRSQLNQAAGGYGNFAQTGGFSPQDIQDIRARAIAPTRAVYQNAQSNIDRQRALQGYSPNYTAATAHLTRGLADATSDANVNANASIAQAIQQGKLAGMGGLAQTGLGGLGAQLGLNQLNAQQQLAGLGGMNQTDLARLGAQGSALGGATNLYGQAPGATSMYGQQLGQSNQQQLGLQELQQQLGLGLIGSQINKSQIPGNYQQALGNIGGTLGVIGKAGSLFKPSPEP